ncbi:MAG: fasciclin domain-containing protein [Woeseiaceae bacterium]|jgi:transforming growth factor-beta-induced protein
MRTFRSILTVVAACAAMLTSGIAGAEGNARFKPGTENIAATAIAINAQSGEFSTLLAALTCTDLVPAVADPDVRLTVFAPTDAAFLAALGVDDESVCTIDKALLTSVLLLHVTEGRRLSPSVINGRNKQIETLNGGFLFPVGSGSLTIDATGSSANIVIPDVLASNGVIHAIDFVLLP